MNYLNPVFIDQNVCAIGCKRTLRSSMKSASGDDGWSQLQLGEGTSLLCVIGIVLLTAHGFQVLQFRCGCCDFYSTRLRLGNSTFLLPDKQPSWKNDLCFFPNHSLKGE